MPANFEQINYDSLLDDDNLQEEDVIEEEVDPSDEIPMIPDQQSTSSDENSEESEENEDEDVLTSYLKSYGISDPTKIQFEGDDGELSEVDFNSLSKKEQLTMLHELGNSAYTEDEQNMINWFRANNTDLPSVINYYARKAVADYVAANPQQEPQKVYEIDDYTDDELYMADMKARFPDFTDEEIEAKLDAAKLNEDTFKKEVDSLRAFYKEEADKEAEYAEFQEQQQYEDLRNSILDATSRFSEIKLDSEDPNSDSLEIEDEDRNIMLDYLLTPGTDGRSQFDRDLSDPNALIELAWLRTHGRDTLNGISQYWKQELAKTRKDLAKAQKELEKYKNGNDRKENVVVNSTKSKKNINSVNDIWG